MKKKTILNLGLLLAAIIGFNVQLLGSSKNKSYTFLGVETSELSNTTREQLDIKGMGCVVENVINGTSAEAAGLMNGDILIKYDDQRLVNSDQLGSLIRSQDPGDSITLQILRKGERLDLPVTLGETSKNERKNYGESRPFLGVESHKVSGVLANQLDLPKDVGITISRVVDGSGADNGGMKKNDILISMNGENIEDSSHLGKVIRKNNAGDEVAVDILRKGKPMTLNITLGERKTVESKKHFSWFGSPPEAPDAPDVDELNVHVEVLQEHLHEMQMHMSDLGDQIMEHIPEIVIKKEGKDGSQRTTVIKMSERSVVTTTDDLIATMISEDGVKSLSVTNTDGDVLYEGGQPTDEELEALPDDVQEIILSLLNNEHMSLEALSEIDGKDVKVIIHTSEDETYIRTKNPNEKDS